MMIKFLDVIDSLVYIKPFENEIIKDYLQKIPGFRETLDLINEIGVVFIGLISFLVIIILLGICKAIVGDSEIV